jgi:hypothetical protein
MKASLVAYDFKELHKKSELKNSKIWVCQRLPEIASHPNLVAQNFKGYSMECHNWFSWGGANQGTPIYSLECQIEGALRML